MTAQPDDGSWGIMLGWGAFTLVVLTCLDAAAVPSVDWRLVVIAAAVAVIAERAADARTALGCAVIAFALADGFLQHDAGALRWDARLDYPFVLGLLGATALGMCAGQLRVTRGRLRRMRPFVTLLQDAPEPVVAVTVKEAPRIRTSAGGDPTVG